MMKIKEESVSPHPACRGVSIRYLRCLALQDYSDNSIDRLSSGPPAYIQESRPTSIDEVNDDKDVNEEGTFPYRQCSAPHHKIDFSDAGGS